MFRRKGMMTLIVVMLMVAVWSVPARAAGSPWSVWLYENAVGRLTQVDSSGATLRQVQLPADMGSHYSQGAAVSQDGSLVGYAAATDSATILTVFNLNTNAVVYTYTMPGNQTTTSLDFSANQFNFSENNTTFAFGYMVMNLGWQIVLIDLNTFSSSALKESDVPLAALPGYSGFMLPAVAYNRSGTVKFTLLPLGIDGAARFDAYTWKIGDTAIARDDSYVAFGADTLPLNSDVVMALSDDRFPDSVDQVVGYPVTNTLQVYSPATNERFVVAVTPRIYNPHFIQGGERVGVVHTDVALDGNQTYTLQVLERPGALAGVVSGVPNAYISGLIGTLNGFVFTSSSNDGAAGLSLFYVETRLANPPYNAVPVWTGSLGTAALVWSSDANPAGVGMLAGWGRVNLPTVTMATPLPAMPAGDTAFVVGMTVQVQTTDNDVLNMRSGPGKSFARLGTIGNGTLVTLVEGPQNADGLIWWRVRLPTGAEGWVVTEVDGVKTLLPR